MSTFCNADLLDKYDNDRTIQVAQPLFTHYGSKCQFSGLIKTLDAFEDNTKVRKLLEGPGDGHVLVVDSKGSTRFAMLGDQLALLAVQNNWAGVLIHGCLRDSAIIKTLPIGVMALNTCPRKSVKQQKGTVDVELNFAGVSFRPGEYIYADEDGVLVTEKPLDI
ncbi:regulator-ribonuclease activity [Sphaeroforma arctica JP610]|uniref:4-hydroxy-4-methyl-2-oxoglutarate aldolase n=1 Tax=Sphaeroforma arctica JP610 TaxID=667725 RepID=A0A0L0FLN6_9EUKA|nr:regulator-ribonuclease activity [Sphaeroforma arctica JP610]KNC77396.1 regulator-ribonuclease activity [Sphaeroforma arctica JP610]|eukprot:XP_014151298.1 regulator-ribonuclease activity [Sphaeroforma arctica JP610]